MIAFVFPLTFIFGIGASAQSCIFSRECQGDEVCLMGVCKCPEGQVTHYDICIFKNKTCSEVGQVPINGRCYKTAWVHQRCLHNEQCLGKAICENGFCECPAGTTQEGKRCITPSHCGASKVYVNGSCHETVSIYDNCTFNEQCLGGSVCVNETCRCPRGPCYGNGAECAYCDWNDIEVKGECYSSANINEECQLSEQCPYGSLCIKGFCKCPNGTKFELHGCFSDSTGNCKENEIFIKIHKEGHCYNRASIGGKCVHSEQCLGDSICIGSVCKCPNGTDATDGRCFANPICKSYEIAVEGKCWDRVSIGSVCNHDKQCIAKATCIRMDTDFLATCQCDPNTQYDGVECTERPMIRCPYDWVSVDDSICLPQESMGSRCISTAQCKGFAECIQGTCSCPPGFKEVRKTCRYLGDLLR